VNENLRRAMLRARLSEEDVAARLQVDPKTVRRWLEGRVPYLRHRWVLAGLLDANETDLWHEVNARPRPRDLKAVYPNRHAMPRQALLSLFRSAEREIGILDHSGMFLAKQPGVLDVLSDRAVAGIRVRICLRNPKMYVPAASETGEGPSGAAPNDNREALALFAGLRQIGAEIRLHRAVLYNFIYRGDDQFLIIQHLYGISGEREPILYLQSDAIEAMATTYIDAFEHIWAGSSHID
jgi:transcriptional regulator with XRE-family HTH domain